MKGFNEHLDNYGNPAPGGGEYDWVIIESVNITQLSEDKFLIKRLEGGDEAITITMAHGDLGRELHIDGEFVDLGDRFIEYICLLDDYQDQGGVVGKTIQMHPWSDDGA